MQVSRTLTDLLTEHDFAVIDGALATELESRGCDLNHQLWSAKILLEDPGSIYNVHLDYFKAGADIAITASYQASVAGLVGMEVNGVVLSAEDAMKVIGDSVKYAKHARDQILLEEPNRLMLIAGSVGPYGAYLANGSEYRGDYFLPFEEMMHFHRSRFQALISAGADILACETLPSMEEIKALLHLLHEFPRITAWFSFTIRDPETLNDGTPLKAVCELVEQSAQVVALGINCVPLDQVSATLQHLSNFTSKPLLAYPNSGEAWDSKTHQWHGKGMETTSLDAAVRQWRQCGAKLIGGCCRTSPEHVKIISSTRSF